MGHETKLFKAVQVSEIHVIQAKRLVISPGMVEQFCQRKGGRSSKDLEEHQPTRLTTVQKHWSPFPRH